MADGDVLRKLFLSYTRRDDQAFRYTAQKLIAEERQKQHHRLADELEGILDVASDSTVGKRRQTANSARSLAELPHNRERDSVLFDIRAPSRSPREIILDSANEASIAATLREYRKSDVLRTHGLHPRRRLLFCGPPGCGKSLCAEVIAQELDLPLLHVRFDAIVSSYLGETAANLRKVFDYARRGSWVILFDEFDAIGKSRDDADEHGELKRVVNSFLQFLDDFESDSLVVAATNHEKLLDPALWRRFDDILYFGLPSSYQIEALLQLKLIGVRHGNIDLAQLVPRLLGLTHADIERVCVEAIKDTILEGQDVLSPAAIDRALERQRHRLAIIGALGDTTDTRLELGNCS